MSRCEWKITQKSVFSFLPTLTTQHCPHSPAVRRRCCCWEPAVHQSISVFYQRSPRWDRQTDRQTDGRTQCRYIDPVPHTMRAVPINSERCKYSVLLKQKKNLNPNSGRVGNLRVTFSRLTVSGCRASTKHPRSTTCECKGGLTSAELN